MARYIYGGTTADFVLEISSGRLKEGQTVPIYSARTGGTEVTDLTDLSGNPITAPVSDSIGHIIFYGPDDMKDNLWADTGMGVRLAIRPIAELALQEDLDDITNNSLTKNLYSSTGSLLIGSPGGGDVNVLPAGTGGNVLQISNISGLPIWSNVSNVLPPQQIFSDIPIGMTIPWVALTAPTDGTWKIADGSAVSRTEFAELFALIGTTYGVGDDATTFNLPDLRGQTIYGYHSGNSRFNALNKKEGVDKVTLNENQIPSHYHTMSHGHSGSVGSSAVRAYFSNSDGGGSNSSDTNPIRRGADNQYDRIIRSSSYHSHSLTINNFSGNTGPKGGGQWHENMPPYTVLNYLIKVKTTTGASRVRVLHPSAGQWFGRSEPNN